MTAAVDRLTDAYATMNKAIDMVIREPRGPKRWRAANNLWLSISFRNQAIYKQVCIDNQLTRDMVDRHGQAVGVSLADKTLRNSLNIPIGAYQAISKADPDAFALKSNAKKFFKAFPEYTTRSDF